MRAYDAALHRCCEEESAMSKTTRWRFPAVLLLMGTLLLSACGGNEPPATGTSDAPTTPTAAPPVSKEAPAAAGGAVGTPSGARAATPGTSGGGSPDVFQFDP